MFSPLFIAALFTTIALSPVAVLTHKEKGSTISSKTKADYYPTAKPIKVKLIVEKESQRIIGAQIVGGEEVTQRINALSFAIQKGMTVRELAKADTAYAPPLCETWEPMILAAEMVLMKLR